MVGDALPIKADLTVSARSLLTAVGLRLPGVAAVYAVAAGPGRAGARRRAVPRRGGAGAHAAALAHRRLDAGCRPAAGGARDLHVRGPLARALLLPAAWSASSPSSSASATPLPGRPGACRARAGPSLRWPSATSARPAGSRARSCCRWAPVSRCSSPWRWSIAPSSHELTEPPAGGEPQLLRPRHQARRDRGLPRLVTREAPAAKVREAPMLRGRLVKLGDRRRSR